MRRLIPAIVALFLIAACGGNGVEDFKAIKVSEGDAPEVSNPEISVDDTIRRVITEGEGPEVGEGDLVIVKFLAINGRTGDEFVNSFASDEPMSLPLTDGAALDGWIKGLKGTTVGSRVLVAIPPKDGFDQANEQYGLERNDTMLFVFDVLRKQECTDGAEDLPTITYGKDGPGKFTTTAKTTKADDIEIPKCHVAEEGDGALVAAGQTLTVDYQGQVYPDGKVFDSSYERGEPANFQIGVGAVIACWDEGLVGRPVGSRVILVCPSDFAYGDEDRGDDIKGGDTLIFTVDILEAAAPSM